MNKYEYLKSDTLRRITEYEQSLSNLPDEYNESRIALQFKIKELFKELVWIEANKESLTAPMNRIETDVMKIDDDWCGVFIRGDNAYGFAMRLQYIINILNNEDFKSKLKELLSENNIDTLVNKFNFESGLACIETLILLFRSCIEPDNSEPQMIYQSEYALCRITELEMENRELKARLKERE